MDSMDCPNCDGTGYTEDATGEEILCPMCDGAGIGVAALRPGPHHPDR